MRRYLALQITCLCVVSAFFGFKANDVVAHANTPFLAALSGGGMVEAHATTTKQDIQNFEQVLRFVESEYLEQVEEPKALIDGAIQGTVAALGDRYSRYVPTVASTELEEDITGVYGGIGILIERKNEATLAATVFKDSPAAEAGMEVGDIIVGVDGEDVTETWITDIVGKIKGPVDTPVIVAVYRPATGETLELEITRKDIKYPSVFEEKILEGPGKIGYIQLIVFNDKSGADFAAAVQRLKDQGIQSLVVDLRQNTGGTFKDAFQIADTLVPGGPMVFTQDRSGEQQPYESLDAGAAFGLPLVLLTDGFSASASEIVAGAVQDTRSGVLVGSKTFGKGVVQSVIPLKDGSNLILTTAKYLTPHKRDINSHGIRPDIPVDVEEETADDAFVQTRITRLEALQEEAIGIRQELQDYFKDQDFALQEAIALLSDPARYQEIVAQPGPTPADDEAAWAAEQAEAEAKEPVVDETAVPPPSGDGTH